MKFLYCTDLHLRSTNPRRRKDDYLTAALAKVAWVCGKAREEECEAVLFGGDLFDSPAQPYSVLVPFLDVVAAVGVPWYYQVGNHDVPGGNLAASVRSAIGAVTHVDRLFKRIDVAKFGSPYAEAIVWANHYEPDIDSRRTYLVENKMANAGAVNIVMAHSFILGPGQNASFEHVKVGDIETNADLFLCSHWHPGFEPVEVGNTLFVAPGAMTRIKATDVGRTPQAVIIEIEGRSIEVKHLAIPCRPDDEVFDLGAIERDRAWQGEMDGFVAAAAGVRASGGDVRSRAKEFAAAQGADEATLQALLERIDAYPGGDR